MSENPSAVATAAVLAALAAGQTPDSADVATAVIEAESVGVHPAPDPEGPAVVMEG